MARFCDVSGHKIKLDKSKMFASKNVHFKRAIEFSRILGIGLTPDLGKYLGVPLLHKRAVKLTYAPLVSKFQKRLASWQSRFLSMAGRSVLIKSVLSAIPAYQMKSTLIPKGVLQEKDKISHNFFWNRQEQNKKMHLIAWDTIKQSKKEGGLDIKDLVY